MAAYMHRPTEDACAVQSSGDTETISGSDQNYTKSLSLSAAEYDASIQKLFIPHIGFRLSCPTELRIEWTSGQPAAQSQQPSTTVGVFASCLL